MMTQQEFRRIQAMHQWLCGVTNSSARLDQDFVLWWETRLARQQVQHLHTLVTRRKQSGASLDMDSILEEIG